MPESRDPTGGKGTRYFLMLLGGAGLLGALVIGFHPDYRQTFLGILRGEAMATPIRASNAEYYRFIEPDR